MFDDYTCVGMPSCPAMNASPPAVAAVAVAVAAAGKYI